MRLSALNRQHSCNHRSSNAKTNTCARSTKASSHDFYRLRDSGAENMLGRRGCSHKSVYWAVPETCRRTLGSRYQICNPISPNAIFAEAPHASSRHSLNSHVRAAVGLVSCSRFQQYWDETPGREVSWRSHDIDKPFLSKDFVRKVNKSLACCI